MSASLILLIAACVYLAIGVPVAVTIAGGYGRDIDDTVRVHLNTVGIAAAFV